MSKECRICFDTNSSNINKLIAPCKCSGTSRYVHETCLNKWRNMNTNRIPFFKCMECRENYQMEYDYPFENFIIDLHTTIKGVHPFLIYYIYLFASTSMFYYIDTDNRILDTYNNVYEDHLYLSKDHIIVFYMGLSKSLFFNVVYSIYLVLRCIKIRNYCKFSRKMFLIDIFYAFIINLFYILPLYIGSTDIYLAIIYVLSFMQPLLFYTYNGIHNGVVNYINAKNNLRILDLSENDDDIIETHINVTSANTIISTSIDDEEQNIIDITND